MKTRTILFLLVFLLCAMGAMGQDVCVDYLNLNSPNVVCTTGSNSNPKQRNGVVAGRHSVITSRTLDAASVAGDPFYTMPDASTPTIKLGDNSGGNGESITYTFDVPNDDIILIIQYAVVIQGGGLTVLESSPPSFTLTVTDANGNNLDAECLNVDFASRSKISSWTTGENSSKYKNWTTMGLNLTPYKGSRIKLSFQTIDCRSFISVHSAYAYFALKCVRAEINTSNCVNGNNITLSAPEGFRYEWALENTPNNILSTEREIEVAPSTNRYVCRAYSLEQSNCYITLTVVPEIHETTADAQLVVCGNRVDCTNNSNVISISSTNDTTVVNTALSYKWDFGDGVVDSTSASPSHSYTRNGTYNVTLRATSPDNCYDEWSGTVNITAFLYDTLTLCDNELPYDYNGHTIARGTQSGDISINFVDPDGCNSIVNLHLVVLRSYSTRANITICQNDLPYQYHDTTFASGTRSGTYTVRLTSTTGCDSIVTLRLTVQQNQEEFFTFTTCDNELPVTLVIYNRADRNMIFADTTLCSTQESECLVLDQEYNISGCPKRYYIDLTVNKSYESHDTIALCSGALPYYHGLLEVPTGSQTGDFEYHGTTADGCDSIVHLHAKIAASSDELVQLSICENDLPYTWRDTTFDASTASGTFFFYRTSQTGCDSVVTLQLDVKQNLEEHFSYTTCDNELPVTLVIYNRADRNMIFADTTLCSTQESACLVLDQEYNISGCPKRYYIDLTVNKSYESHDTVALCSSALPYYYGLLEVPAGSQTGDFKYNGTSVDGCDSVVFLHVDILPTITDSLQLDVCTHDFPYMWRDTTFLKGTASGTYTFKRTNNAGCDSNVVLQLTVLPASSTTQQYSICDTDLPFSTPDTTFDVGSRNGTYTLTRLNSNGCTDTININLTINVSHSETAMLNLCANELPYAWRDTIFDQTTASGTYIFNRKNSTGCDSVVTLTISLHDTVATTLYDSIQLGQTYTNYGFNITPQTAGNAEFTRVLTTQFGCDSTVTLHLAVLSVPFEVQLLPIEDICADQLTIDIPFDLQVHAHAPTTINVFFTSGIPNHTTDDINSPISIDLPQNIRPDSYSGKIEFASAAHSVVYPLDFTVRYASSIIAQKWNNVLALRNASTNGGYQLVEYKWYKDGVELYGENKSYLYLGEGNELDFAAEYMAEVRREGENYFILTCPLTPVRHYDSLQFPTLLRPGGIYSINGLTSDAILTISYISGQLVSHTRTTSAATFTAPQQAGVYLLTIEQEENRKTYKLIVQ